MATRITQAELIRVFTDLKDHPDDGCCFLLGAGASVSSGIPSGGDLVKRWYEELKQHMGPEEFDVWQDKERINPNRIAEFYPKIFERRFRNHPPDTGYFKLQDIMKDAEPGIGYSFLAQVLATDSAIEGFMHRLLDIIVRFFSLMNHSIRVRAAYFKPGGLRYR